MAENKTQTSAVIPIEDDKQVAAYINAEHGAALQAGQASVALAREYLHHAANAGEALLKKKERIGHGHFLEWCRNHLSFPDRTARHYMLKAKLALEESKMASVANLTPDKASAFLSNGQEEQESGEPSEDENAGPEQEESGSQAENQDGQESEDQQEGEGEPQDGEDQAGKAEEPAPARYPHSDTLCSWLRSLMGQTLVVRMEQGGIQAILAERDKWNWNEVRTYLLPTLADLEKCIKTFRKEISRVASDQT